MKTTLTLLALLLLAPAAARAQRLQIDHLDRLAERADEAVNVTVDERMLKLFASFIPDKDPEQRAVKEFVVGLKGIFVRNFEFDSSKSYTPDDITAIRRQLTSGNWVKMVTVDKPKDGETVDVHMWLDGDKWSGLAVVVAERTKLTVVNIVGPIDVQKLTALKGIGLPDLPKIEITAAGGKD